MKYFKNLLIIILFLTMTNISLFGADPIRESFIINSLEMESDRVVTEDEEKITAGEIIFDDSFDDILADKIKKKLKKEDPLQELKSRDRRWHLIDYRVRKNDNIWIISKKFGVERSLIIDINGLKNPDMLKYGQKLKIPSRKGVTYRIRRGDTLGVIAKKYRTSVRKIASYNRLKKNRIIAGETIFIPGASEPEIAIKKRRTVSTPGKAIASDNKRSKPLKTGKLVLSWPLKGPITSGFGYRKHPITGKKSFHCGMDIGANVGTEVHSAATGRVIFSGWKGPYGRMIVIAHDKDYITVYAHNRKNLVKVNDRVGRGDVIALSGKTGAVTGAHLHFEIRKGITPLNPRRILKK